MSFMSAIRSITAPTVAVGLLGGLVGVVVGAGLAVTTIHLASTTTLQTPSTSPRAIKAKPQAMGPR